MSIVWSGDLWFPYLRWPYVAGGWGQTTIRDLRTGHATYFSPGDWTAGWLGDGTLMTLREVPGGMQPILVDPATGTREEPAVDVSLYVNAVAGGSWAACNPGGRVVWDGRVIDTDPRNHGIKVNGDWCAFSRNYGGDPEWQGWRWRVYLRDEFAYEMTPQIPALDVELTADGCLIYSDHGDVRYADAGISDVAASATTNRAEYCPIWRNSVWWSVLGGEAAHVLQQSFVNIVFALQHGAVGFDADTDDAGQWVIAYCDATGRCTVKRPEHGTVVTIPFAFGPDPEPPTPPTPPLPPTPEPPMTWQLESLLRQWTDRFPLPPFTTVEETQAAIRAWTQRFAEQAAWSRSILYGCKSTSVGSPQSNDVIAYADITGKLYGWDIVLSAGAPHATVNYTPDTMDITGQRFIPVGPQNHLGGGPTPPPPPPPPSDLEGRVARLERIISHHRLTE